MQFSQINFENDNVIELKKNNGKFLFQIENDLFETKYL